MEMNQMSFLEELLLAQSGSVGGGGNPWGSTTTFHGGLRNEVVPNPTTFLHQDLTSNTSLLGLLSEESNFTFPFSQPSSFNHVQDFNMVVGSTSSSTYNNNNGVFDLPPVPIQDDFEGMVEEEEDFRICPFLNNIEGCKVEHFEQISDSAATEDNTSKIKKAGAPPSKNLMAERRRRKRLNDRLSMLRSIVPKISKMDRTAIVGDTIDYMKELLDKIGKLQDEKMEDGNIINQNNMICNDFIKPKESLVLRNTPKFDVERRKEDTRIELHCGAKPGMLLSTLGNLEALGLEVQQCVISCFNDFSLQASCSEVADHRGILSAEDIKQALFRNAGYGGRCL